MAWKTTFNEKACNSWISYLLDNDIAVQEGKDIRLQTPFEIEIPAAVAKRLTASYKDAEETGGLLFCQIVAGKNATRMVVKYHEEIRNDVEVYYPGYSKAKSYCSNTEQYLAALHKNFSKKVRTHIYFPIHYHTHPTSDLTGDIRYLNLNSSLTLSDADKNAASRRTLDINGQTIAYLNAILTGSGDEHRIIFYGNGISPFEFSKVKMQRSLDAVVDMTEGIKSPFWKGLARAAIGVGSIYSMFKAPQLIEPMLNTVSDFSKDKHYYNIIDKRNSTVVSIPLYNADN